MNSMQCENCGTRIPSLKERFNPDEGGEGGNCPYAWWDKDNPVSDETKHYACSEECFRVAYLGCEPSKKAKKKAACPDCRALRARCAAHRKVS